MNGWINVKDRLPEQDEQVLVCLMLWENQIDGYSRYVTIGKLRGREWGVMDIDVGWDYVADPDKVSHWQKLPEMPIG